MKTHFDKDQSSITSRISLDKIYDLESCEDEDCHEKSSHCIHHCTGIQNFIRPRSLYQEEHFSPNHLFSTLIMNFKSLHYEEPFIDPALKPPLFV